jgi:hypothetical protein
VATRFEAATVLLRLAAGAGAWRELAAMAVKSGASDIHDSLELARCGNDECRKVVVKYDEQMIRPLGTTRPQPSPEVPSAVAGDYVDACNVEPVSKKAAAALARRCLQNLFHDQGISKANLEKEIEEAMLGLPSNLADDIDAIRHVGNFAAHPTKSTSTGEIVEVEPEEAEYLLDTLYDLFDHYYVKPAKSAAKRAALQAKLTAAGKNVTIKTKTP